MPSGSSHQGISFSRIFGAMVGLVFLVFNLVSFRQNYLLKESGVTIQGVVIRTAVERHRGGMAYSVDYAYDVSGQHFAETGQITAGAYLKLRPGGPIAIRYASSSPSISEPSDMSHNNVSLWLIGLLGFPISLFILGVNFRRERLPAQYAYDAPVEPETRTETISSEWPTEHSGIAYLVRQYYEKELGLKGGRITFEVDDVDASVSRLREKGVRVKVAPVLISGCRTAVLVDANDNIFTLHQAIPKH